MPKRNLMISQKVIGTMVSIVGASGRTPMMGERQLAPTCQALRSKAHFQVRRNDEVAAQRRR